MGLNPAATPSVSNDALAASQEELNKIRDDFAHCKNFDRSLLGKNCEWQWEALGGIGSLLI
jgi:hypothetical protein